jgi:hypothetical protein
MAGKKWREKLSLLGTITIEPVIFLFVLGQYILLGCGKISVFAHFLLRNVLYLHKFHTNYSPKTFSFPDTFLMSH